MKQFDVGDLLQLRSPRVFNVGHERYLRLKYNEIVFCVEAFDIDHFAPRGRAAGKILTASGDILIFLKDDLHAFEIIS